MLAGFIEKHKLDQSFEATAQKWYIPLANELKAHHNGANKTVFVGMNGCQGSGKSTLSEFLKVYLEDEHKLNVLVLSLDDFYLSKSERLSLSIKVHPLFATRGVPGTHDITEISNVLNQLKQVEQAICIPKFNKATDDRYDKGAWATVTDPVDIVIFEGWCWGVEPQLLSQLQTPVNEFEKSEDPLGIWRQYVNRQLAQEYVPIYQLFDCWIMLKAPDFSNVFNWRLEQEQKLADKCESEHTPAKQSSAVMNEEQVRQFIQYYQRLTEHSLETLPERCNWVFTLNDKRQISKCDKRS